MAPYAAAVLLSALLLFLVQPLAGRVLLPWYGGSAAVWSACLLFFQAALFLGYLYAHRLGGARRPRRQAVVHGCLLLLSLAALPVAAPGGWAPRAGDAPVPRILGFLAATTGLPYLALAATSPLIQRWRTLVAPGAPWRLYALSNLGSLLGLIAYPLLLEPLLPLAAQRTLWSGLYLAFAAAVAACAAAVARAAPAVAPSGAPARPAAGTEPGMAVAAVDGSRRGAGWTALVGGLAAAGSLLMAATTQHLCQNVAVVPLLWILPLALYLASFVVVFADDRCYRRAVALPLAAAATAAAVALLFRGADLGLPARVGILSAQLFAGCLVVHGEMARLRPEPGRLTGYYLLTSAGGALGTAFVTFAAPLLFAGHWEYHVALAAGWALALAALLRGAAPRPAAIAAGAASLLALVAALRWHTLVEMAQLAHAERNFYGVVTVVERDAGDPALARLELANGGIVHGSQLLAPDLRRRPTAYYGPRGGLGLGLEAARARRRAAGEPGDLAVGCVGLGVGAAAAHAAPGDRIRFYELNPAVERLARSRFTYLADAAGAVAVVPGDARLSLEREAAAGDARFDVLVLDAFSGDAVPAHLLTREAFRVYRSRLRPGGRILLHASNRYLDLRPLALGLARDAGLEALVMDTLATHPAELAATWVDFSPAREDFSPAELAAAAASRPLPARRVVWTDEYSNLLGLLARREERRPGGGGSFAADPPPVGESNPR